MVEKNFESWFKKVFVPAIKARAPKEQHLLIYDGHGSHIAYPIIQLAIDNQISIVCLPPIKHMLYNPWTL